MSIFAMVTAAACSPPPSDEPSTNAIDRLEAKLSAYPCIGSLRRWSRSYAYSLGHDRGVIDRGSIDFLYQEAGKFEFREGRHVFGKGNLPVNLDDRPYLIAFGTYIPTTDKLEVSMCGPNAGE